MAHFTKKSLGLIVFYSVSIAIILWFLLFSIFSIFNSIPIIIFIPLSIILTLLIFIGCVFLIAFISCIIIRLSPINEGKFKYIRSHSPKFWHKKMGHLRIIEILVPKEMKPFFYNVCNKYIHKDIIFNGSISDPDLVQIGENTIVGIDATILSHTIENDILYLKTVKIGKNCTIGMKSLIMPGVTIEDSVMVGAYSLVPKNKKLPMGSVWAGIPVKRLKTNTSTDNKLEE